MIRFVVVQATILIVVVAASASAQSGSGSSPRYASPPGSGSTTAPFGSGGAALDGRVALDGYCPVCLLEMKDWVAGVAEHQVAHDGRVYRFPDAAKADMFRTAPARYAPALGGDDVVEYARTGRRTAGKTAFGAKYLDRHYFFASAANKQAFSSNPVAYADADLALGGACVVCQVDMRQSMPGSPRFVALHGGLRFQFAGPQQRAAFLAQPTRYTPALPPGGGSSPRGGSGSAGSGSGGF